RCELGYVAVVDRHRAPYAVHGDVRVGVRQAVELGVAAGVEVQRNAIAGPKEVRVHNTAVQNDLLRLGITDAATELSWHPVFDREVDVDQVRTAGHGDVLHFDILDEGQPLQANLGTVHEAIRQESAFRLSYLAPQHLIVDFVDSRKIDAPHIHPAPGIDEEGNRGFLRLVIQFRHGFDLGVRIPFLAKAERHEFAGLREQSQVEDATRLGQDQPPELLLRNDHLAD